MSELENLKNGVCPFTGGRYDCGRCEKYKELGITSGAKTIHIGLVFEGLLLGTLNDKKFLHNAVGGKRACTLNACIDYFTELHQMGATRVPIGDNCGRFCYRSGCVGNPDGANE